MLALATLIAAFGSSFQYGYNVAAINSPAKVGRYGGRDAASREQGGGFGAAGSPGGHGGGTVQTLRAHSGTSGEGWGKPMK